MRDIKLFCFVNVVTIILSTKFQNQKEEIMLSCRLVWLGTAQQNSPVSAAITPSLPSEAANEPFRFIPENAPFGF